MLWRPMRSPRILTSQQRQYSKSHIFNTTVSLNKNLNKLQLSPTTARVLTFQHGLLAKDNTGLTNVIQCRNFMEDNKTTALTLIKDLKHIKSSPIPALVLGLGGVIPFAAAPAYTMYTGGFMTSIAFSQVAYGACILSFLGGVRWGLTVSPDESIRPDWFNLSYSVTPSLISWVGLLLPTPAAILTLISGLLGACFMDVTMWGYPPWFKALRFLLTFCAVLSLWTTLMCRLLMGPDKSEIEKAVKEEKSSWFRLPWKSSKPKAVTEMAPVVEKAPMMEKTPVMEKSPVMETTPVSEQKQSLSELEREIKPVPVMISEPIIIRAPLPVPDPPMDIENDEDKNENNEQRKYS